MKCQIEMPLTVSDFPVKSAPLPGSEGCVLTLLLAALEVGRLCVHRKFLEGKTVWIHRIVFAKIG